MQDVYMKLNPGLPRHKQHSTRRRLFPSKLDFSLRKKLVKCYIWSIAMYSAEIWTLQKVSQKHLESFEPWCWRWMEISWTNGLRNEEVLHTVKERNILTPWSRDVPDKLTGPQLVKKFPVFHGTKRFITAFTTACHLSLS